MGSEEAGGGAICGEDVVCWAKEGDEVTEEEGGRPLSCRKTSNMDELDVAVWYDCRFVKGVCTTESG